MKNWPNRSISNFVTPPAEGSKSHPANFRRTPRRRCKKPPGELSADPPPKVRKAPRRTFGAPPAEGSKRLPGKLSADPPPKVRKATRRTFGGPPAEGSGRARLVWGGKRPLRMPYKSFGRFKPPSYYRWARTLPPVSAATFCRCLSRDASDGVARGG
jgi:hypothetical protein